MTDLPSVSVLLAQHGKTSFTWRAVEAIRRSDYRGPIEILVLDNASPEGPGRVSERDDVRLLRRDRNLGFGPGMNVLAAEASGDLLLILNNDTVVDPRCLRLLVERHQAPDRPGTVTPQYRDFDGQSLEMGCYVGPGGKAMQLFNRIPPPTSLRRMSYPAHYGSGACLLCKRDAFLGHGGFDAAYAPAYYEDVDLCLKLAREGRPTVVEPRAIVYHYEGATAGRDVTRGLKSHQTTNRTTLVERWDTWLAQQPPVGIGAALTRILQPEEGCLRILWAGPTLPRPDRDGGGRRAAAMLRLLRGQGHAVAAWARSADDPDRYGRRLEEGGVPWFGGSGPARWPGGWRPTTSLDDLPTLLEEVPWDAVIVFFARLANDIAPAIREHTPRAALLVDNGDLHFLRHERARSLGIEVDDPLDKETELAAYEAADGVVTASGFEDWCLRVELPGLATHVYTVAAPEPHPVTEQGTVSNVMFLGNFGHPPNVDAVDWWLEDIAGPVAELVGERVPLRLVGAGTDSGASELDDDAQSLLDIAGWVPELAEEFARARVFVAPLRYGAGTKGKILDALAFGTPVVTTSIGAEGFAPYVQDALVIADDAPGLAAAVAWLVRDDAAWSERRDKSLEVAERAWREQEAATHNLPAWIARRVAARRERAGHPGDTVRTDELRETLTPPPVQARTPGSSPDVRTSSVSIVPDPVFVLGAPRSGTSMMQWALRQHPRLWGGEESDFLIPLIRGATEAHRLGCERGELHWLSSQGVSREEFLRHLGYGINALYTQRSEGLRWIEQTPQYTLHLDDLLAMFPGARFVFMLRDGRSVVHSLRHFVKPVEHERACHIWRTFTEAALRFADSLSGDALRITPYEKVVRDTEQELKEIFDFLELDHEPASAAFISERGPINSSFAGETGLAKTAPRWHVWTPDERRFFHEVAGDLLIDLGYEEDRSWMEQHIAP